MVVKMPKITKRMKKIVLVVSVVLAAVIVGLGYLRLWNALTLD